MAEDKKPVAKKTPARKTKEQRVRLMNTNPSNGTVGDIATPLKKDEKAWRDAGWVDAK